MISERISAARELLTELQIDALMVTSEPNRRRLSGFTGPDHGPDELGALILIDATSARLLTGSNELEWARGEINGLEAAAWGRPWTTSIIETAKERGWSRVGFEDRSLIVADFARMRDAEGAPTLVPLGSALDDLRAKKDSGEAATLRKAFAITDAVFEQALNWIPDRPAEIELARRIEQAFREAGADGPSFTTIVASGPHAARPHHRVSQRRPEPGEPIIIDMGAQVEGYAADLTRTVWVGEPAPKLRAVYNAVLAAQAVAFDAIRPGASGAAIDQAVRDASAAAGFAEAVIHSVGHGVGLRVHEAPSLSIHADQVLAPGHVVTVEPGLYFPGWGGVRIEDVVLVTSDGFELLSHAPKAW